jgi:hypothetical protein
VGPPLPPAHHRPYFNVWEAEQYGLCRDDVLDLESTSASAIHILGTFTEWVMAIPASDIPRETLGEISRMAWELFGASLRIPWALAEFEALCSDPPALREAAGLPSPLPVSTVITGRAHKRPHTRRGRRSGR